MSCSVELIKVGADAVVWAFAADVAAGNPACMTSAAVVDQTAADPNPVQPNSRFCKS